MNLFEYEGKALFRSSGIPTPEGTLLTELPERAPLPFPFVVKAQVLTGGRGKAGGVRMCADEAEFRRNAAQILDMRIKGHRVHGVLCEQAVQVQKELYCSITLQGVNVPTLIFSAVGGMDIEEVSRTQPERVLRIPIDPATGLKDYQCKQVCFAAPEADAKELTSFLKKLYGAFCSLNALLLEVNPLGIADSHLIAMDSKVVLDDHAGATRQLRADLDAAREPLAGYVHPEIETTTITYVPLEGGEIGLISDGAGTGMMTLDLISEMGGKLASFCELGGTTPAEVMYRAMKYTMERKSGIRAIMIVLIGGFNRMDDMANGITQYLREHALDIPIFTRMCGTMEEEGKRIMAEAGLKTYDNLTETVRELVKTVQEG